MKACCRCCWQVFNFHGHAAKKAFYFSSNSECLRFFNHLSWDPHRAPEVETKKLTNRQLIPMQHYRYVCGLRTESTLDTGFITHKCYKCALMKTKSIIFAWVFQNNVPFSLTTVLVRWKLWHLVRSILELGRSLF